MPNIEQYSFIVDIFIDIVVNFLVSQFTAEVGGYVFDSESHILQVKSDSCQFSWEIESGLEKKVQGHKYCEHCLLQLQ